MKKHHRAFIAIAAVLFVHIAALAIFHFYERYPSFDIPMHFAGGFAAGLLGLAIHHYAKKKYRLSDSAWWHDMLFVGSFVMLVAVFWEFYEYLSDLYLYARIATVPLAQPSLADTMGDLALGLLGGLTAFGVEFAGEALERKGKRQTR